MAISQADVAAAVRCLRKGLIPSGSAASTHVIHHHPATSADTVRRSALGGGSGGGGPQRVSTSVSATRIPSASRLSRAGLVAVTDSAEKVPQQQQQQQQRPPSGRPIRWNIWALDTQYTYAHTAPTMPPSNDLTILCKVPSCVSGPSTPDQFHTLSTHLLQALRSWPRCGSSSPGTRARLRRQADGPAATLLVLQPRSYLCGWKGCRRGGEATTLVIVRCKARFGCCCCCRRAGGCIRPLLPAAA